MPFGLWRRMGPRNYALDGSPQAPRDVTTNVWLSMGYNFGCMIASDSLFDSRVGFRGQANRWRHSRDRVSKGRCHSNHFSLSIYTMYIGATWRIRLSRSCAAAMRPYVKLLWPLVIISNIRLIRISITPYAPKFLTSEATNASATSINAGTASWFVDCGSWVLIQVTSKSNRSFHKASAVDSVDGWPYSTRLRLMVTMCMSSISSSMLAQWRPAHFVANWKFISWVHICLDRQ